MQRQTYMPYRIVFKDGRGSHLRDFILGIRVITNASVFINRTFLVVNLNLTWEKLKKKKIRSHHHTYLLLLLDKTTQTCKKNGTFFRHLFFK